jgi:hypothetical protein
LTDDPVRQTPWVVFQDADKNDERMAAILVSKDADTGELKSHVEVPEDKADLPDGVVDMVVNAVEIANL